MFEYKIHTQRDKTISGAFDPTEFVFVLRSPYSSYYDQEPVLHARRV